MKKMLVVLLALALIFAFAACGQQAAPAEEEPAAEGLTAIPLGGDLPDVVVEGDAYGLYQQIEVPNAEQLPQGVECDLYYAEGADTPYIAVYRWAKNGKTLEEETASLAEQYDASGYQMSRWENMSLDTGYFMRGSYGPEKDGYYYVDSSVMEDGDDFVVIDFYAATVEIALGESGMSVYIPVGYTDLLDEDCIAHGGLFYAKYGEGYDMPYFWISKDIDTYEGLGWYWQDVYPEGLPFDEDTLKGWMAQAEAEGDWSDELNNTYYEAFGCTGINSYSCEVNGVSVSAASCFIDEYYMCELYFSIGEEDFFASVVSGKAPARKYGKALAESIHSN